MDGRPRKFILTLAMCGAKRGPQWGRPKIRLRIFQSIKSYSFPKGLTHDFDPKIQIFLYFKTTKGRNWSFFFNKHHGLTLWKMSKFCFFNKSVFLSRKPSFLSKIIMKQPFLAWKNGQFSPQTMNWPKWKKDSISRRFYTLKMHFFRSRI